MAKYTYFLDFGSGDVAIHPDKDAIYQWKREHENIGFMRKNVKSIIITRDYDIDGTFPNATVFNTLWEYYFDVSKHIIEITINIYKDAVLDYSGVFYVIDGDINVNTGTYMIKPVVDDDYRTLLAVANNKVDIIDGMGAYTARLTYTTTPEEYTTTDPNNLPAPEGSWDVTITPNVYGRQKSLYDDGGHETQYYQGYYYLKDWNLGVGWTFPDFEFPNCYLLTERIQFILDEILTGTGLTLTLQSEFFIGIQGNTHNADNYVTAEENFLMNTLIQQRSDTKDPDATDKATKGTMSFIDILSELRKMFDVSWYIDSSDSSNKKLVIEHEKFFYNGASFTVKTAGINLTDAAKYIDPATNEYYIADFQNYQSANIKKVKTETIIFEEKDTIDFRDDLFYLNFDTISGIDNKVSHSLEYISTDVPKAINNPDDLSDDGFYLFNCENIIGHIGDIIQKLESSIPTNPFYIANSGFGVKWLLHDYYEYNRYNKTGLLVQDSGSTTPDEYAVISTAPLYLQKDIVFLLNNADNIDVNKYIATYLIKSDGSNYIVNGSIEEIEQDLNDDFVTATLGYEL